MPKKTHLLKEVQKKVPRYMNKTTSIVFSLMVKCKRTPDFLFSSECKNLSISFRHTYIILWFLMFFRPILILHFCLLLFFLKQIPLSWKKIFGLLIMKCAHFQVLSFVCFNSPIHVDLEGDCSFPHTQGIFNTCCLTCVSLCFLYENLSDQQS